LYVFVAVIYRGSLLPLIRKPSKPWQVILAKLQRRRAFDRDQSDSSHVGTVEAGVAVLIASTPLPFIVFGHIARVSLA
jgi:hypothetical protein